MLLSLVLSAALLASAAASYDNPSCPQPACTAGVQAAVQALQPPIGAMQEQLSAVQRQLAGCDGGCPDGWSYHLQSNACYLVPDEKLDWWSALRSCVSLDPRAHLASLHAENNEFVTGLLQGKGDYVWVGLFVPNGIAKLPWGWVDGTPLNFKNWLSPNPNNKDGVEGCGVICNWDGIPLERRPMPVHLLLCVPNQSALNGRLSNGSDLGRNCLDAMLLQRDIALVSFFD